MTKFYKTKDSVFKFKDIPEASLTAQDDTTKYSFINNLQNQNFSLIPHTNRINIDFSNLTLSIKEGNIFQKKGTKIILNNISGSIKSGQLTGIMGPSGSGKSTLMSLLAGSKAKPTAGEIHINGKMRDLRMFRKMSCYIMQDDHLLPQLTVWEAMMISANLKLKETLSKIVKEQVLCFILPSTPKVTDILWLMGLFFSKDTKSDKLSGGQRKRLSIALELVNNPPVMFFDEATRFVESYGVDSFTYNQTGFGLDSVSSYQCLRILKKLAQGGRNIICTIHQPSARLFEIFDNIYVLAQGQCLYQGPQDTMVHFLSSHDLNCPPFHNPADFIMEIACGEYGNVVARLVTINQTSKSEDKKVDDLAAQLPFEHKMQGPDIKYIGEDSSSVEETDKELLAVPNGKRPNDTILNIDATNVALAHSPSAVLVQLKEPDLTGTIPECRLLEASVSDTLLPQAVRNRVSCPLSPHQLPTLFHTRHKNSLIDRDSKIASLTKSHILMDKFSENQCYSCTTSFLTQFRVLFVRAFLTILRDGTLTRLRLTCHLVIGVLIGLLYYNIGNEAGKIWNNSGCLFFSMLFIMFAALMPTVLTFPTEMMVFIKEHLNYWYSLKCYYFAKTLADLPFQIIFPLIYGTIVYWMTSQPPEFTRFVMFLTLSTLTALVSQSLGLIIGAAMSLKVAVFLGPVTAIPILLFSGFFINFDTIPPYLQWLSYLSYVRYSFEGVLLSIYGFGRAPLKCQQKFCFFKKATDYLELMDVDKAKWHVDFIALCIFFVVLRGAVYFVLKWRICKSKW